MSANHPAEQPADRKRVVRQKYLVNPTLQLKYTVAVVLGVFAVCSLLSIVLFDVLREQARAGLLQTGAPDVWENTWAIVVSAASFAAITAVVFGVATVLYTHRITGPIYVMRRYLVDLIEGRAPQYRPLRKNDEFKDFYDVFWKAVRAVQTRKQAELDHLTGALDAARSAAQNENQGLKDALDELGTQINALNQETTDLLRQESDTPTTAAAPELPPREAQPQ